MKTYMNLEEEEQNELHNLYTTFRKNSFLFGFIFDLCEETFSKIVNMIRNFFRKICDTL